MVADPSAQRQRSQRFRVEAMRIEHIPVVSAIERRCFAQPWPQNAYRREIQSNRMAHYFVVRVLEGADAAPPAEPRRPAASGDGNLFERLSRMLRGPLEPAPSPALEAELRSIVGYAGLWLMTDEAHITTIAVDPDYQRRGIARQLMARSAEHMRAQGMDIAAVGTGGDPGHGPARALYEALGYTALPGVRYLTLLD